MVDGYIQMILEECVYRIHFNIDNEYPLCEIIYSAGDEDYQALELSQKTFIADKVNTDKVNTDKVNTDKVNTDKVNTDKVNTGIK